MRRVAVPIAIASALVLLALAVPFLIIVLLGDRDPFDKFEVMAIEGEHGSGRYAVTYRYHHADSSRDVFATWVLPNPPPIGSAQPPPGRAPPVLVWTNHGDVVARKWSEGRLVVTAKKGTDRREATLSDCYFEYDLAHLVCFDPGAVQLVDEGT